MTFDQFLMLPEYQEGVAPWAKYAKFGTYL